MTVIAWDGKMIAADKRATNSSFGYQTTKLRRLKSGEVLAITGDQGEGVAMMDWYEAGADPSKYPEFQKDEKCWCRLIVASAAGAFFYERACAKIPVEGAFMAWGSGRDFALMAMLLGKTAREAAEMTAVLCVDCGHGVDYEDLS